MRAETAFNREAPKHGGRPLIAHVIYRLDVGGLENGLVNLINRIPPERFRHAIICLTDFSDFRSRLRRPDVVVYALRKPAGPTVMTHYRLWRLLRALRPDIVHTRNLSALEALLPAALAGVPARVHGEHGRDVGDLDGENLKYQLWRRLFSPLAHRYIALSKDLESYLRQRVRVPPRKTAQIYNGVDAAVFRPPMRGQKTVLVPTWEQDAFVIGTVGRMQPVKDQLTLARAFVLLRGRLPASAPPVKLVMVGDGPLRREVESIVGEARLAGDAWLPGARNDVAEVMRGLDLFVLPSLAEGISNTILEAMASGLPVIATSVGGNPELVHHGRTGRLVPRGDAVAMADAMLAYVLDRDACRRAGRLARMVAERDFSMDAMADGYCAIYDGLLRSRPRSRTVISCAE